MPIRNVKPKPPESRTYFLPKPYSKRMLTRSILHSLPRSATQTG